MHLSFRPFSSSGPSTLTSDPSFLTSDPSILKSDPSVLTSDPSSLSRLRTARVWQTLGMRRFSECPTDICSRFMKSWARRIASSNHVNVAVDCIIDIAFGSSIAIIVSSSPSRHRHRCLLRRHLHRSCQFRYLCRFSDCIIEPRGGLLVNVKS